MKILFLFVFVLISCGKDKVKNTAEPIIEDIAPEQSIISSDKASLSYLEIIGFDPILAENKYFKIPTKELKLFSKDSPVVFNFDQAAKDFLKEKIYYWEEVKILFKSEEEAPINHLNLKMTTKTQRQTSNQNNKIEFNIDQGDIHHLWDSINPIEIWVDNKNDNLIEIPLKLNEKVIDHGEKRYFELNASHWFKIINCHVTHNEIVTTYGRGLSGTYGSSNRLDTKKVHYQGYDCSPFFKRIVIKNEFRSLILNEYQDNFRSNSKAWELAILPSSGTGKFRHGKHYLDYNQIDWFNITVNWID